MARNFNGSSQDLNKVATIPGVSTTDSPFTVAVWAKPASTGAGSHNLYATGPASPNGYSIQLRRDADAWNFYVSNGVTDVNATEAAGVTSGAWRHVVGVQSAAGGSGGSILLYTGGVLRQTTSLGGIARVREGTTHCIGGDRSDAGTPNQLWDGDIAEFALWDVALTQNEITALSLGFSPLFIRPNNLQCYQPLIGVYSPEIDIVRGFNFTVSGSPSQSAHPAMIYAAPATSPRHGSASGLSVNVSDSDAPSESVTVVIGSGFVGSVADTISSSEFVHLAFSSSGPLSINVHDDRVPQEFIDLLRTGTVRFREIGVPSNTLYEVRVRAYNTAGIFSAFCPTQQIVTALDSDPPAVPTGLRLAAGPGALVKSDWDPVSDADIAYYRVFRNTSNDPTTAVPLGHVDGTEFIDR